MFCPFRVLKKKVLLLQKSILLLQNQVGLERYNTECTSSEEVPGRSWRVF